VSVVDTIATSISNYMSTWSEDSRRVGRFSSIGTQLDRRVHLEKAVDWLCVAQDATPDGGVSRSYHLAKLPYFDFTGWASSYAETTGYIIPTFLNASKFLNRPDLAERAMVMADWEVAVQMESGAVCAGLDLKPETSKPAIFNTGQVMFGWLKAWEFSRREDYLNSAVRAGEFLVSSLDDQNNWTQNISPCTDGNTSNYRAYNTRTAWALYMLGQVTGEQRFSSAALKNVEYIVSTADENGWLANCCLDQPSSPLIHTIAYATRGIMEVALSEQREDLLDAASLMAEGVMANLAKDGFLVGRLDQNWDPVVAWSCLTGTAQMGIIWGKLYKATGQEEYLDAMERAISFLSRKQITGSGERHLEGGLAGSFPVSGGYGQYQLLNWAAKFFADLLMLERVINDQSSELELSAIY